MKPRPDRTLGGRLELQPSNAADAEVELIRTLCRRAADEGVPPSDLLVVIADACSSRGREHAVKIAMGTGTTEAEARRQLAQRVREAAACGQRALIGTYGTVSSLRGKELPGMSEELTEFLECD